MSYTIKEGDTGLRVVSVLNNLGGLGYASEIMKNPNIEFGDGKRSPSKYTHVVKAAQY